MYLAVQLFFFLFYLPSFINPLFPAYLFILYSSGTNIISPKLTVLTINPNYSTSLLLWISWTVFASCSILLGKLTVPGGLMAIKTHGLQRRRPVRQSANFSCSRSVFIIPLSEQVFQTFIPLMKFSLFTLSTSTILGK